MVEIRIRALGVRVTVNKVQTSSKWGMDMGEVGEVLEEAEEAAGIKAGADKVGDGEKLNQINKSTKIVGLCSIRSCSCAK